MVKKCTDETACLCTQISGSNLLKEFGVVNPAQVTSKHKHFAQNGQILFIRLCWTN